MKGTRVLAYCVAFMCAASVVSAQSLVTVYSDDFQSPPGSEWSKRIRSTTPIGARTFLGEFGGEPVYLDLVDLPEHCSVTVSLQLFIIGSWEGSVGYFAGPDIWDMNASTPGGCCPVQDLLHTTFANCECRFQAYPDIYPDVHNPGLTGADEVGTLGYESDSVYNLRFTFFHSEDDLRLSFAGSPNLQRIEDESWGIDNIVVRIDDQTCCRATRHLPSIFGAGQPLPVEIVVTPDRDAQAYLIEENPPADWPIVDIDNGGVYDSVNGVIKWGPFFDHEVRTLSYKLLVPADRVDPFFFNGSISVDGASEDICGDRAVNPGSFQPADRNADYRIGGDEFTAYGAAWLAGEFWPMGPVPIPSDLVTNAGVIWKSGETYLFDPGAAPPWVPTSGFLAVAGKVRSDIGGDPASGELDVELTVTPDSGTLAYLVTDGLPQGWAVSDISDGGSYDAASRTVRWGPYFDDELRTLSYTAMHVSGQHGFVRFSGSASFNGTSVVIEGDRRVVFEDPVLPEGLVAVD